MDFNICLEDIFFRVLLVFSVMYDNGLLVMFIGNLVLFCNIWLRFVSKYFLFVSMMFLLIILVVNLGGVDFSVILMVFMIDCIGFVKFLVICVWLIVIFLGMLFMRFWL